MLDTKSLIDSSSSSPDFHSGSDGTFKGCDFLFAALTLFFITMVATFLVWGLGGIVMIRQECSVKQQLKNDNKV